MGAKPKYQFLGNFINDVWQRPVSADEEWENESPADLKTTVMNVQGSFKSVELACEAAKSAFKSWHQMSVGNRLEHFKKLKEVFNSRTYEIAEAISHEVGKPLWESKTEAAALAAKIDVTIEHSLKLVAEEKVANALPGIDGFIRFKPRGVMAVIGPFNFPAHLPNGHIIPALITGNTVVFKPSDKTPAVGQLLAECIQQAGFPAGVFNLVQGKAEVSRRLVRNDNIDGVLFTGSYDVGLKIKQDTLEQYWKLLALEMGGKNTTVIWNDADMEKALYETIVGAYLSAGQRCSCTSRIVLHSSIRDKFIDNFHANAKKLSIGHWSDNKFMGPLISAEAVEKYMRFQEIAKREGAESLMRGKAVEVSHQGHYVTPSINIVSKPRKDSIYQMDEIFGPNVAIYTTDDIEEALEVINMGGYGLVAAIFSKDRAVYEKVLGEARVGLLNWNRTTNGASSRLPFGGLGKSGNDRPSGHFAVQYCTTPVASLEDKTTLDRAKLFPGVDFSFEK